MARPGRGWRVQKPTICKPADVSMPLSPAHGLFPSDLLRIRTPVNVWAHIFNASNGQLVAKPWPERGRQPQFPGNRHHGLLKNGSLLEKGGGARRSSTIVCTTGNVERYWRQSDQEGVVGPSRGIAAPCERCAKSP